MTVPSRRDARWAVGGFARLLGGEEGVGEPELSSPVARSLSGGEPWGTKEVRTSRVIAGTL
jgi:hypothetical protein